MQEVIEVLEKIRERGGPPPDQLRRAVREHLRIMATHYEGAFLLQQEYDLATKSRDEIRRLRDNYETMFRNILEEGEQQRLFRIKDVRVAARVMLGAINWLLRWYRSGGRLNIDEIADAYIDFFFYGILAPYAPGRPLDTNTEEKAE
jgi:hypothetical protein